jgi:Protein of unknown function (DUF1236)
MRMTLVFLAILAGTTVCAAQQAPPTGEPQQQSQQERAQQTPSGKLGTEEPSARAPTSPQQVFVNGSLAVPGAPETDMVPAKFSQKNAADDALSIAGYTFKLLTPEQRRVIYQELKGQPVTPGLQAEISTELPFGVEARPVPDEIAAAVPQTRGYQYVVANNQVMLVSPATRFVVGVFSGNK